MNQKGFVKYILVVILPIILVLWYLVSTKSLFLEKILDKIPLKPSRLCCVDQIADWKTYKNEKYDYEIKYPHDWFIGDMYPYPSRDGRIPIGGITTGDIIIVSKNPINFGVKPDSQAVDKTIKELVNNSDYFTISRYGNSKMMTVSNWILKDFGGGEGMFIDPEIKTEIIGGNRVTVFTASNYGIDSYFIFDGKDVFEFVSRPNGSNNLIFKQILSSFKFTK